MVASLLRIHPSWTVPPNLAAMSEKRPEGSLRRATEALSGIRPVGVRSCADAA